MRHDRGGLVCLGQLRRSAAHVALGIVRVVAIPAGHLVRVGVRVRVRVRVRVGVRLRIRARVRVRVRVRVFGSEARLPGEG